MKYVVHRRFKRKGLGGDFNLPRGTGCVEKGGVIYFGERPICLNTSQVAKEYFAVNADGQGLKRGDITHKIAFEKPMTEPQKRVVETLFQKFLVQDPQTILFNAAFFHASILELLNIKTKLGVK